MFSRRFVLRGLIAAPMVVAALSLMPVRSIARFLPRVPRKWYVGAAFGEKADGLVLSDVMHLMEARDVAFVRGQHFDDVVYAPCETHFEACSFNGAGPIQNPDRLPVWFQ